MSKSGKSNSWADQIKIDILDLKMRMTAIETQVNSMKDGLLSSSVVKPVEDPQAKIDKFYGDLNSNKGVDEFFDKYIKADGSRDFQSMSLDLASATYSIRTAETAAKGYLMLLGQMGLTKDQKALIRDLEQINMAVMKVMATVRLLQLALAATNPYMMAFYLFSAGGTAAASIAYSNKVSGGGV